MIIKRFLTTTIEFLMMLLCIGFSIVIGYNIGLWLLHVFGFITTVIITGVVFLIIIYTYERRF